MQTSKSYGGRSNNVEVKLELDDLEYVFADGQNLIINSEGNSEDTDEGNVRKYPLLELIIIIILFIYYYYYRSFIRTDRKLLYYKPALNITYKR